MAFEDDGFLDDNFDVNELVSRFEDMVEKNQSYYFDADELNVIVEQYLEQDNIEKANLAADMAMRLHPSNPTTKIIKAKKLIANSHATEALSVLDNPILDKEDPDYQITLGSCYSALNDSRKAIVAYKKAVKAFDFKECEYLYSFIGAEYENIGDYENALKYFINGLNRDFDIEDQYNEIKYCYSMLNKINNAVDFFKMEIDNDPYSIPAWIALSDCYIKLNDLDSAIDKLEYVLAIDPHNSKAYIYIAKAYNELEKYTQTIEIVEEAVRYNAETAELYCLDGEANARLDDTDKAIKSYMNAIKLDEKKHEAYAEIGYILCDKINPKSALKFLKHAHLLSPNETRYMYAMIEQYNKIEEFDDALDLVREIIEIDPYDEDAYITMMECHALKEDDESALAAINEGLSMLPNSAPMLYRKAFLHFVRNEKQSGLMALEEALQIDYDGLTEFMNFDTANLSNDIEIMELIDRYRIKNNKQQ